ncbi:MAG: BatD family protein [Verrucomicrobiia bacterium]
MTGLILVLAGLCLETAPLHAVTFTSSLDRDTLALGETATLSLTFEGGQPQTAPSPDVSGLQIINTGNSQNFSIVNGQMSSTVSITFSVSPKRTGEFVIPAMTVDVNGQALTSPPLKLRVTEPNSPPPQAVNSGSEVAFMKLRLPKDKVYAGEVVTAQLELYFRQEVQNYGNFQINALPVDGFTTGKLVEGPHRRVQIGNAVYTVVPAAFTLTAQKTGPVSVGPITGSVVVVLPASNQGGDPFFRQFFNNGEQKQISLAVDAQKIESLPLPAANAPPNFNGAIGSYTMAVSAGPTNVAVGDPITVHVQISGRGALDALALPDQPAWRDFKAYPPTQNLKTTDQLGIEGTKTFEQIVTPQNTDVHELPAFAFSFFDPDAGTYRTLTEPPVQLAVHSGGTTPLPVIAASQTANPQTSPQQQDILPIKEQLGTLTRTAPPRLSQPAFLAAQSLPVLAWITALVWRKRADNLANNPRLRRQRQVALRVRHGLADLRRLAAENKSDEFFAALFRLLQEQLGERLDCPASSITEAVIDERLVPLGVPETVLVGLRELFHLNNQARYAPMRTSGELAAVISQFENALQGLQTVNA